MGQTVPGVVGSLRNTTAFLKAPGNYWNGDIPSHVLATSRISVSVNTESHGWKSLSGLCLYLWLFVKKISILNLKSTPTNGSSVPEP